MFSTILILALPLLAVASPFKVRSDTNSTCETGTLQCCQSYDLVSPHSERGAALLEAAGLTGHVDAYVGSIASSCNTGISILGAPACGANPVCCSGEPGLVTVGCVPVSV